MTSLSELVEVRFRQDDLQAYVSQQTVSAHVALSPEKAGN